MKTAALESLSRAPGPHALRRALLCAGNVWPETHINCESAPFGQRRHINKLHLSSEDQRSGSFAEFLGCKVGPSGKTRFPGAPREARNSVLCGCPKALLWPRSNGCVATVWKRGHPGASLVPPTAGSTGETPRRDACHSPLESYGWLVSLPFFFFLLILSKRDFKGGQARQELDQVAFFFFFPGEIRSPSPSFFGVVVGLKQSR